MQLLVVGMTQQWDDEELRLKKTKQNRNKSYSSYNKAVTASKLAAAAWHLSICVGNTHRSLSITTGEYNVACCYANCQRR